MHLLRDGTSEAKKRPQTSPLRRRWPEGALQGTERLPQRRIPGSLIDAIRIVPCGHGGLRRRFSGGPLQALLLCLVSSGRRAVASAPRAKGHTNRVTPDAVATEPTESGVTRFVRRQRSSARSIRNVRGRTADHSFRASDSLATGQRCRAGRCCLQPLQAGLQGRVPRLLLDHRGS
jgi:hypothetical protein